MGTTGYEHMQGVEQCDQHAILTDTCDTCQGEALRRGQILDQQMNGIVVQRQELAQHGVAMPDMMTMAIRLEALVETLSERERFVYESRVNDTIATHQADALREVGSPKLQVVKNPKDLATFGPIIRK